MIINGNYKHREDAEQGPKIIQIREQWQEVRTWLLHRGWGPSLPGCQGARTRIKPSQPFSCKSNLVCQGGGKPALSVTDWKKAVQVTEP